MDENHELDLDNPHVGEQLERLRNRFYRLFEAADTPFDPEDFFLLGVGFDYLSEEEMQEIGRLAFEIEREGREGLEFTDVTDAEMEYGELVKTGIDRYKENETIDPDRFPEDFIWPPEERDSGPNN